MGNQILSMFLDVVMAVLLLATIIYCLKLNSRIRVLQDSKSDLARIIREFDESTQRATQNINEIHAATDRISENIQMKIDKANYVATDLELLIDRGNKVTGKADAAPARTSRQEASAASSRPSMAEIFPARSAAAPKEVEKESAEAPARRPLRGRSRAEQELLSLLGNKKQNEG